MAVTTRERFLELLTVSNLLTPEQLAETGSWETGDDPRHAARRLVQAGWLTRWQAQQLLAGRSNLFLGRYKLLDSLGQGGMGAVFKAEQAGLNRIVALKVMSRSVLHNPEAVDRFLREIQSAATLNHPHIVRAFDASNVGKTYFLVMEHVPGKDLKAWVRQHGRLPVAWACEVIRQAALGLQHAHEHGMVHRDIKPSNLLIVSDPRTGMLHAKILDMGLAKFVSSSEDDETGLTQSGQIMGTPDYMAPEQGKSTRRTDIRADIYALGVTLFELLAGRLPFQAAGPLEKLMLRIQQEAPRARSLRPELPLELDEIVARMLARDPDRRYQTPAEVAQALAPYALATMPAATGATLMLTPTPAEPPQSGVIASADTSLNGFLHALGNQASKTPATPTSVNAALTPTWRRRRAGKTKPFLIVGAVCVLLLVAGAVYFRQSNPPENPQPGPPKVATDKPREPAAEVWIDLLSRVDPVADTVAGTWRLNHDGELTVAALNYSKLKLPWRPPLEYDLRIEFTRTESTGSVDLILLGNRRQFNYRQGTGRNTLAAVERWQGQPTDQEFQAATRPLQLETGKRHLCLVQVRVQSVRTFLDGKPVIDLSTDFSRLIPHGGYSLGDATVPGLGANGSPVIFHRVEVREVSGPGQFIRSGDPEREAAVALYTRAQLQLKPPGKELDWIKGDKPLPPGPLEVYAISFNAGAAMEREELFLQLARTRRLNELVDSFNIIFWTPADLERLAELPCARKLRKLWLPLLPLTPEALDALKKFPQLVSLDLGGEAADDAVLVRLADELPQLNLLTMRSLGQSGGVTKQGLAALARLSLTELSLRHSRHLNREWITSIAAMPALSTLNLGGSNFDDAMLEELSPRNGLRVLYLEDTKVTDAGMPALGRMTALDIVTLNNAQITDAGLPPLKNLPRLGTLDLRGTSVTETAARQILNGQPGQRIVLDKVVVQPAPKAAATLDQ